MNIDISDIKSFIAVAELKSISGAAQQLNYLQSNMTAKVKKIENHYKRPLFIRKPKGVELTDAGLQIYAQYKKMLFTWEETENKIHQQDMYLRFGTNTSLGGMRFYPSFSTLYTTYPELSITMKTGATGFIENELLQGHIDLAYVLGHPTQKNIHYVQKGEDELVLIGKDVINHRHLNEALEKQNLLFSALDCCYAQTLDQIYQDYQINKGEFTHINDYEALIHFTQLGMGVSVVTKSVAKKFGLQYFMEIPEKYRHIGLYLITRHDHILTPIEKQFIGLNERL